MSSRNRFTECNLNDNFAAGQVAAIIAPRHSPVFTEDITGFRIWTVRYTIVLGGPNPCSYSLDQILAAAAAFSPVDPGDSPMPVVGQIVTLPATSMIFAVKAIQNVHRRTTGNCRWVDFDVTLDNACLVDNPFYKADGSVITSIAELPEAVARITRRHGSRQVNVESADYVGLYNRKGKKIDESTLAFDSATGCCRPIQNMWLSVTLPDEDRYDDSFLPVNAAGVPFDPPMQKDLTEASYILSKPFFAVDGCKLERIDNKLVNCTGFWLVEYVKGRLTFCSYVKKGTARIESINLVPAEFCDGTPIVVVEIELRIRKNIVYSRVLDEVTGIPTENKVGLDFGWDELVPNKGLGALICKDDPDQFGGEFTANDKTTGGAMVQAIFDASGNPVQEPQWLDHKGHPIAIKASAGDIEAECAFGLDQEKLIYIRYAPYNKVSFTDPEILPGFVGFGIYSERPAVPPGYPADFCECVEDDLDAIYICTTTTPDV